MESVDRFSAAIRQNQQALLEAGELEVHALDGPPVVFSGEKIREASDEAVRKVLAGKGGRDTRSGLEASLEEAWGGWDLRGAIFVFEWRGPDGVERAPDGLWVIAPGGPFLWATDPMLVLNVLARTRGKVLMAGTPPDLDQALTTRVLASTDTRLADLARRTGKVDEVMP